MRNELLLTNNSLKSTIIGTGLLALDVVVDDETNDVQSVSSGGTCGNVLAILSYFGWNAFPIARLNGDVASRLIRSDLARWGVSSEFLDISSGNDAPVYLQRNRRNKKGAPVHKFTRICPLCGSWWPSYKPILADAARSLVERIDTVDVFFFDRVSRGNLILAEACSRKGAVVFFEPSSVEDLKLFREALALSHIVKYSYERLEEIDINSVKGSVVLEIQTLGSDGLRYKRYNNQLSPAEWEFFSPFAVHNIRDTAGSGDWCTAGLVHVIGSQGYRGLSERLQWNLSEALSLGQALAAWNCGFIGARGGMYQVDKIILQKEIRQVLSGEFVGSSTNMNTGLPSIELNQICPICSENTRK